MSEKFIPLARNAKVPPKGAKGNEFMTDDWDVVREWIRARQNIGLLLKESRRVVLDFDTGLDAPRRFYQEHPELCTFIVATRRGIHFHFKGETKTRKFDHGDIKASGHVVYPPSKINGFEYKFIRQGELQPFPEHLFPIAQKVASPHVPVDETDPVRRLIRAREWMKKREGGEEGNDRGMQMIKTCRALFKKFQLTEDQVWPLILEFNERACIPPYTEKQLRHKIEDAQK